MNSQAYKGVTLLDTVVVVSIIAVFSVLAFPSFTSSNKYQLDLAANEISAAIRFARSEALRTGNVYGVDVNRNSKQLTIYKADLSVVPVAQEFIAYHPVNKNLYDYNLNSDFNLSNIDISNTTDPFLFSDSIRRKSLLFTSWGAPVWIDSSSGAIYPLQSGIIEISTRGDTKNINIEPFNGRVF